MRYWIKLYTEIVNDPKMGRLPTANSARASTCLCLLARFVAEVYCQSLTTLAWRLRCKPLT